MVEIKKKKNMVSFPVSVWYSPDTGNIHIARPTDQKFRTTIAPDANSACGHPSLYTKLSKALRDAGAPHPGRNGRIN